VGADVSVRAAAGALPARLRVLTVLVPVAGALALAGALIADRRPVSPALFAVGLALAAAVVVADFRPVRIAPQQKTSLATVPILVAAFLLPAGVAALLMVAAVATANWRLRRRPRGILFNAGMVAIATTLASEIGHMTDVGFATALRAGAAVLVVVAITILLPALASAAHREVAATAVIRDAFRDSWPQEVALGATAIVCAALLLFAPWLAALPLALLPLVYRTNRLIEAELDSKQALARLLASQRRFLTDVSHNVGNPLATILTNLTLLRRARLPAGHQVALADAAADAARLAELFRRLRVLAETDDELPLQLAPVDLAQLASDLVRAYAGPAASRGVRLDQLTESAVAVTADPDLLRQAAANLVENAIRHSPAGAAITLRVTREQREARLEVIDRGPGIEPERLSTIFERFEHGPEGGSGLGLAIARSVVERHGGSIVVDSRPGAGSRFAILLPAA
jgi:signal transduction histidine kinase